MPIELTQLSEEIVPRLLQKHFPSRSLQNVSPLYGGLFNLSCLLSFSDGFQAVLRIAPDTVSLPLFERKLMQAEQTAYAMCHRLQLPVPDVIATGEQLEGLNRPYMLSKYIPASSLLAIHLPPQKKADCYRQAGMVIRKLHSIRGDRFGRLAVQLLTGGFDTWSEALCFEAEEWAPLLENRAVLPAELILDTIHMFSRFTNVLNQIEEPLLVHGDLWDGNILATIEGEHCRFRAVIDADHAIFGDPEYDFMGSGMINAAFTKGYGKPLKNDSASCIRRKLYLLLFTLRQAYIYQELLLQPENATKQRIYLEHLLFELK